LFDAPPVGFQDGAQVAELRVRLRHLFAAGSIAGLCIAGEDIRTGQIDWQRADLSGTG
jgi:hypothetical protein